jgi:uncharacterized membrane protein
MLFPRVDKNPEHWRLFFFYYNRDEPQLLVPRRITGTGFTMNFARPAAWIISGVILALPLIGLLRDLLR